MAGQNTWLRSQEGADDIEATLLRELLEDHDQFAEASIYDPYCSDLLAMDFLTKGHRKRAGVIVYPMGQSFDSLGRSSCIVPPCNNNLLSRVIRCFRAIRREVGYCF
jgi:hypothetical protein